MKEDTRDLEVIMDKTAGLCEDVHASLMQRGVSFKSVGILAVMKDMSIRSRSKTLKESTRDLQVLKRTVRELFQKFLDESELEARRVGVKVSNFVKRQEKQRDLTSFLDASKG